MKSVRVHLSEGRWFRGVVLWDNGVHAAVEVTDPGTVDETIGRHVLCSPHRLRDDVTETPTAWVSFMVRIPVGEMHVMDAALAVQGFAEDDWCAYSRPDGATATYGPCEPPQ